MNYRFVLFIFLIYQLFFSSCVSVQLTNYTTTEHFTQDYAYMTEDSLNLIGGGRNIKLRQLIYNENADFDKILDDDTLGSRIDELLKTGKLKSKGFANLSVTLVPENQDFFFISGIGFYDIYDETTDQIFFSAKFYLIDSLNYFSVEQLIKDLKLDVYFDQLVINHIPVTEDGITHIFRPQNGKIKIEILFKNYQNNKIIGLDYDTSHLVTMEDLNINISPANEQIKQKFIKYGFINFGKPLKPYHKIIDLRKYKMFTRKNYKRKFNKP